jgi:hypothetical protein
MADICPFFGVVCVMMQLARSALPHCSNHPKKGANIGRRFAAADF